MSMVGFEHIYSFSLSDKYYYRIHEYTPATQNREHKHKDVESGLESYTANWEHLETNTDLRRGSSRIYLVEDEHYIECSRTGFERAGNCIQMSESTPEELRRVIIESVFEGVAHRKFGDIKEGVDKVDFTSGGVTVSTPKDFILADKLTEDELRAYYDELAEIAYEMISRYHDTESVGEIKQVVEWYSDQTTELFRDYAYDDFTPTILYQVLSEYEFENGWVGPSDLSETQSLSVMLHEDYRVEDTELTELVIQVTDEDIKLINEVDNEDTVIKGSEYESKEELRSLLDEYTQTTPEEVF